MEPDMSTQKKRIPPDFSTLDYIDAIVLVADTEGEIVFTNSAVERIFGFKKEQILGDGWWNIVANDEKDGYQRKKMIAGMAAGSIDLKVRELHETPVTDKNGKTVWLQWTNSRTSDSYLVGVGQVITERKEIEEKLKRYTQQVQLLHTIDKIILSLAPIQNRIEAVLEELEKNISFVCRTTLAVTDVDTQTAKLYRKGKIKDALSESNIVVPLQALRSVGTLEPGKHFIIADLNNEKSLSDTDRENLKDGIVSYLAMPVYFQEKLLGVLFLCSNIPNPFNTQDLVLAHDVSNSLALAIQQSRLEQTLIQKNAEKELLLKEIHHRVKNNLQVISSLLNMQSDTIDDVKAQDAFQKSKNRINAMALIHTKLYESGNLSRIDFQAYLNQLIDIIAASYSPHAGIQWTGKASDVILDVDLSINLGLIITELITNSFKHGFKGRGQGHVSVEVKGLENGSNVLIVKDDGVGLPVGFAMGESNSLGLEIVQSLTEQIDGKLIIANENGAKFEIVFDLPKRKPGK
jgi:PAS domain S-box-containing protein